MDAKRQRTDAGWEDGAKASAPTVGAVCLAPVPPPRPQSPTRPWSRLAVPQMQRTRVLSNFVRLTVKPTLVVSQYDIFFTPAIKTPEGRKEVVQAVDINLLLKPPSTFAYNGDAILYSSAALALPAEPGAAGPWTLDHSQYRAVAFEGTKRKVEVTLKFADTLEYTNFRDGSFELCDRKSLSAIDVAFKQYSSFNHKCVRDAYYDERREAAWAKVRANPVLPSSRVHVRA